MICSFCENLWTSQKNQIRQKESGVYSEVFLIALNYRNSTNPLNFTYSDIALVKKLVTSTKYFDDINELTDENKPLTKALFISKTQEIIKKLHDRPEKRIQLLVHYAGHGGQVVRNTNKFEKDNFDETWLLSDTHILDNELLELFGRYIIDKRFEFYIVSDSCHSGTILDLDTSNSLENNKITCISGCLDSEVSYESNFNMNGYLTKAYVEELEREPKQEINQFIKNIRSKVKDQTPIINTNNNITNWII